MPEKNQQKRKKQRSVGLALKLALMVFSASSLIFLLVFLYDYYFSHQYVVATTETHAAHRARGAVDQIEKKLAVIETVAEVLALSIEGGQGDETAARSLMTDCLRANPEVFSVTVVAESEGRAAFAPYYYRKGEGLAYEDLTRGNFNYREKAWFQNPLQSGAALWTEPYYATAGSDALMCTYAVPFSGKHEGKSFSGVVTADIVMDWLTRIISGLHYVETGYAFLISRSGTFISHPNRRYEMNESLFTLSRKTGNPELAEIGRVMTKGRSGRQQFTSPHLQTRSWVFYRPFTKNGWSLGLVIPHDELFLEVRRQTTKTLAAGIAGLCLLALAIMLVARRFARPIRSLAESTTEIARGNLEIQIPELRSRDEVGQLSSAFENMRRALREYIQHLKETTAAKEKIEGELKIAHRIQMSFLPQQAQLEPPRKEFELSAAIEPAREVGGDLYDFFLMDGEHLFFAIGDVSDKGVPAALFMAVTKTLIKGMAEAGRTPSDILERVNAELSRDNASMMFVTLCCGILNLNTGELQYSNAGHNPPLIFPPGGQPEWLPLPPGLVLAAAEEVQYETRSMRLSPGAMLLLYTDGVTEAMDKDHHLYGENRLMQMAADSTRHRPERLIERIVNDVHRHSGDAAQSDDITLLAVAYHGTPP